MVDADSPRFVSALHGLGSAFRVEPTDEQIEVFWMALRDEMTIEAFEAACLTAVKRLKFFPAPAHLLEARPPRLSVPALPPWIDEAPPVWTPEQKAEAADLRRRLKDALDRRSMELEAGVIRRRRKP